MNILKARSEKRLQDPAIRNVLLLMPHAIDTMLIESMMHLDFMMISYF